MNRRTQLVKFLKGDGVDSQGRSIQEMVSWTDSQLENTHDYIQWVFPSQTTSRFVPNAPVADPATIQYLRTCEVAKENVRAMYGRMLLFFGFRRKEFADGSYQLELPSLSFRPHWVAPGNHNFHRITRIMLALRDLGLDEEFDAFCDVIELVARRHSTIIGQKTIDHWEDIYEGSVSRLG